MDFDVRGHPLHTRALSVQLVRRADGLVDAVGSVLDLRKRGFVPVGGDLQSAGVVHDMRLVTVIDPSTRRIVDAFAEQPAVAFEPSAATLGESCRDPIDAATALAGAAIDGGWPERVGDALGGPRGCFHVFTLAHFLGATAAWALDRERARFAGTMRPAGQRIFRRDLVVDGAQQADDTLAIAAQLTDLHFSAADGVVRSMDRLGENLEARLLVSLRPPSFAIAEPHVAERRRDAASLDVPWRERPDFAAHLDGLSLLRGATATLLGRVGDAGDDRPLLDASLMLAPALIQIFAAVADWAGRASRERWLLGMGGQADSCWMWRRDGALARLRTPDDPARL
jgi:hypothetical protein